MIPLDIETTGIDWRTDKIEGVGIGAKWYPGTTYKSHLDPSQTYIIFNSNFDLKFLCREGHTLEDVEDPYLASFLLDYPVHSLAELSAELGFEIGSWEDNVGKMAIGDHCVAQLGATEALHNYYLEQMRQRGLIKAYELERTVAPIVARMEMQPKHIDWRGLSEEQARLQVAIKDFVAKAYDLAGKEFNINSPPQLAQVLYEELGLPVLDVTEKTGNPSTSEPTLRRLSHPIVECILKVKEMRKLLSTFINPLLEKEGEEIYGSYHQAGTVTGRFSSSSPNLQNIPKEVRWYYKAKPGHKLIIMDYNQLELRWMAALSGCKNLRRNLQDADTSVHVKTAEEIMGVPDKDKGKLLNFALIYGRGAWGLAKQLDISTAEASGYIRRFFREYPEIRAYQHGLKDSLRDTGEIRTPLGRRFAGDLNDRQINNYIIQSAGAELVKQGMVTIYRKFGLVPCLQVHDEMVYEVEAEEADAIALCLENIAENQTYGEMNFPAEVKVSGRWDK